MKKTFTLFLALVLTSSLFAVSQGPKHQLQGKSMVPRMETQASTFKFLSSIPAGWTVNPKPNSYESTGLARGMQMTATTTITYSGAEDVSSVTIKGSTNGAGNTISVKVGSTNFGSTTLTKNDRHKEYKFSGTKSSGNVVITVTRVASSIWIESVSLDGTGGGGGSDTIAVEDVDGLEIDYYPSYSEVGAYDYTFLLYNSEDENYLPMIAFDILTSKEKEYAGTYSFTNKTLTEYSYYVYGTGDDDYIEFTDGEITITDNGEGNYTIKGWFTDGTDVYSVDVTLDGEYFNAEYAYEPEEKTTLNLTITNGEEDNTYVSYGIIDLYLTTAEGEVTLEYVLSSKESVTAIADGTYPIEATEYDEEGSAEEKDYGYFDAGYYYSSYGMAVASNYQTEDAIYYLVGGTVKIETVAEGKKITLAGTTYYGTTINAEYIIGNTALEDVEAIAKSEGKILMNNRLLIRKNGVTYNAQGQVVK